jgi:hypothetical protein
MSRFNTQSAGTKTTNFACGEAFKVSPELELVSILLTSFAMDQYYQTSSDIFERLIKTLEKVDKEFVAKAAIYARTEFGMRSITHVIASELAKHISKQPWSRRFYEKIIYRPDDITEILSYHFNKNGKMSNAMKAGLSKAFEKFDEYQLSKYRESNNKIKLVDAVNLLHPVPTDKNAKALEKLINGTLRSKNTWESKLTQAGQIAESEEEKTENKEQVWIDLITSKKLGYFALLRNLRNIIEQAPKILPEALKQLTDENLIKKSLVLPFRFQTAYQEISSSTTNKEGRAVLEALEKAIDISVKNVPKFDGDTLVVLDTSGSMYGRPKEIGSLFSAVLMKSCNADFMTFSNDATYQNYNYALPTLELSKKINFSFGQTNFHSIFETANKKYDRIIIISDMQGWVGYYTPKKEFKEYKKKYNADPYIYSFDLGGYGTTQFPERNIFCITGFSEKILEVMKKLEIDKNILINEIKKIEI